MKTTRSKANQTEKLRSLRRESKALEKVVLERKRLGKALRESERRVRQLSNATFDAIAIHENGKVLEVNRAFCRMFGYSRSNVVGKPATDLAAPECRELVRHKIAAADTKPYEGVALRKDGSAFGVELVSKPIAYHDRTVRLTAFRDITARKLVEGALKTSLSQLQATLDSTDDAILVVDTESRITNYNKRFLELWQIPKHIMATRNDNTALQYVLNQLKEPEKFLAKVRELYSHSDEESFDVLEFKDGRIFERYSRPQKLDGKSIGRVWSFRDVTERKRGGKALQESVEQFRDLAEKTPNMIFINQKGRIVYANEKCSEIMGYTSDEFLAPDFDFRRLIAPESLPAVMEKFEEHQKGREVPPYEYVLITKQGQRLHTIHTTRLITFSGERAILGIITDITERKRAEEALRENEKRYHSIVENLNQAYYEADRRGVFTYCNPGLLLISGYSEKELVGIISFKIVAEEHRKNVIASYKRWMEEKRTDMSTEFMAQTKSGRKFWVEQVTHFEYDAWGVFVKATNILRDIHERKRAEEALRQSEIKYRTIFENVLDVFYQTDKEGRIIDISPSIHRYAGYTREELIGRPALEMYDHPEDRRIFLRELYRKGEAIDHVLRLKTKDGQLVYVSANAHLLFDTMREPCGVEGALRDVTQRKLAEEALRRSEENYRSIIDFAPVGIYQTSWEGELITANITLARMLGYDSVAELLEKNLGDEIYFHKDDQNKLIQKFQPMGYAADFVVQWKKKDGTPIWIQLDAHAVKDETGDTRYFEGFVRDFTERKRAEETNTLLAQTLKSAQDCISITDLNDKILFVNHAFLAIYGYLEEDLIGKNIATVRPTSTSSPQVGEILSSTLRGEWHGELVNRRKDGTEFPIELWASVVTDGAGKPIAAVGVARDITERRRTEETLRESEERYRQLVDLSPDAIVVHSGGRFVYVNPAAVKLFGGNVPQDILGKPIIDFVHPDYRNKVRQRVQEINEGMNVPLLEEKFIQFDGTVIDVEVAAMPFSFENKRSVQVVIRDITQRKQVEEALRKQHSALQGILGSTNASIFSIDRDYKYTMFNSRHAAVMVAFYGATVEMGQSILDFMTVEDDRARAKQNIDRALAGESHVDSAYSGAEARSRRYIEVSHNPVRSEDGTVIGVAVLSHDITERKKAEDNLVASEKRFRSIWDKSADGMRLTNTEGRIIEVNEAYCRMVSRTRDNLLGQLFSIVYKRGGMDDDLDLYLERFQSGKIEPHVSTTAILWDGTSIDLEVSSSFIGINGHDKMLLSIFHDTTERRKAEEKIAEQARLLDVALDAIIVRDMGDRLLYWNLAAEKMYGWTFDEARMLDLQKFIKEDNWEKFKEAKKIFLSQGMWEGEIRQMTKDGREITTESRWAIVHDKEGRPTARLIINHDVTKQKQLEEELTQIQKLESIGTLASGIAHDFNNILGIVLGYSTLIERIADDPEKLSQSVQSINAAVQRGANLVKQILTFARKAEVVFGPIDVNVMIKEIAKMLRETFPKTIEMSLQLDRELPFITADATQLHQALLNISVNARDAMPIGGILSFTTGIAKGLSLRNAFSGVQEGDYAHIVISDTGVGMDDTTLAHIFDPFFTTKEKGKGTGLGLSVVYGVMKRHSGFIDVQSEPGKGTTFNLYFPIPEESAQRTGRTDEGSEEIRGGTETILVVEDEEALLAMSKVILEVKGYHVLTAMDGLEALTVYQKHKDEIALVMTDMGLPKISGDQLFLELKKMNPTVRVVLMSGYIDPGLKSEIFKAGVHDFVQKPYNPSEVLKKVRETIDRK